jgi:ATP-dependent Lon protease
MKKDEKTISEDSTSVSEITPSEGALLKKETKEAGAPTPAYPDSLYLLPLNRRPFFPGMAAPIVIEPGAYYEVLKLVAKTEHKCLGLFLTHKEDVNIYDVEIDDLFKVGVVARILRIIPIEQGGAQVVLNMEKRVTIEKSVKNKYLYAQVNYHDDTPLEHLSRELRHTRLASLQQLKSFLSLTHCLRKSYRFFWAILILLSQGGWRILP